jgi:hypothetical protein
MELNKRQGNIFELTNTDYSLVFGKMGMALVQAIEEIGITQNPFILTQLLTQPIEWPNNPSRLLRFVEMGNCSDEELRSTIHDWLKEANQKGKIHLATNGVNNSLQPEHNIKPEFEMRQFERARLLESLILSWCKFNQNNFETITLISMDPDFLDI